jgi:actin-like ATPase involved in cell morphogenesis
LRYRLGIDLGTTFTAAASVADGVDPTMIGLGNRALQVPSVLFLQEDGSFLVGEPAERRGLSDPTRVVREFKRRLGDTVPRIVGGAAYSVESLTAHLLRWVYDTASERLGESPDVVMLTHPANWELFKLSVFDHAVEMAGLERTLRCTEPEAAAAQYAARANLSDGDRVMVYDLGGGTFDVAIMEKTGTEFALLGKPLGIDIGGANFDAAVFEHVWGTINNLTQTDLDPDDAEVKAALLRLRQDCIEAKEALSSDVETSIFVNLPGLSTSVRITRSELETMIRPSVLESVSAVHRALRSAALQPDDLHSVILVGGSSRMPIVAETLQTELGVRTALDLHPKHDVALGAALIAQLAAHPSSQASMDAPSQVPTGGAPSKRHSFQSRTRAAPVAAPGGQRATPRDGRAASKIPTGSPTSSASPLALGEAADVLTEDVVPAGKRRTRRLALLLLAGLALALVPVAVFGLRGINLSPSSVATPSPPMPPESTAALPSPSPSPTPPPKKLAGGSYTWDNGVALKTSIRLVERWGVRHPYCEDGSCGFAKPDDLRVVLGYSVKVPKSIRTSIDPTACPGSLQGTDSKGTSAVRAIYGVYAKPIARPIKAGATAEGVVEYSIRASARNATFLLRSSCGDRDRLGEVGVFKGKIPRARKEEKPGAIGDKPINRTYLSLQVPQVQTKEVGRNVFAALVETCVRKKHPDPRQMDRTAASWWSLSTSAGTGRAIPKWDKLLPAYPYGSFARKGDCASGWIGFKLAGSATQVYSVAYYDRWGTGAVWVIRAAPIVRPPVQPTIRPPVQPRPRFQPRPPTRVQPKTVPPPVTTSPPVIEDPVPPVPPPEPLPPEPPPAGR